jgi:Na+-transporting methylmalonyl-CoA/oxaloacetate decarboxylase gamma subunit
MLFASALPAHPEFLENLAYQITGILVVVSTLGGLALVVWLAGKAFTARDRRAEAASAPPNAAAIEEIPGPVLAVISAAVQTALQDERFAIHGIRSVDPRDGLAWSAEGRRSIYASKNLR